VTPALAKIAARREIRHLARDYRRGEMAGFALVYVATDDIALQRLLAAEAGELNIPINVADVPELCSFLVPSLIRRGDLQIAISTSGASPALAARLRKDLESRFGPEYGLLLEILRAARMRLMASDADPDERARKLRVLVASRLSECLARSDYSAADAILTEHLGFTLKQLGLVDAASSAGVKNNSTGAR
jgi:precorrin-2 dehydrogenase/sirohydrochlorin ferrochelatase